MHQRLDHAPECRCVLCRRIAAEAVPIIDKDRALLAHAWATWVSTEDGEVDALMSGRNGSPGSPRWVALQAIAIARRSAEP